MNWRDLTSQMRDWSGWRRYAPAGTSFGVHVVVLAGLASLMATATPPPPVATSDLYLAVELLPEELVPEPEPELFAGVTPPPRVRADTQPRPEAPAPSAAPRTGGAPAATEPAASGADDGDTVYLPPSILTPDAPAGLRSLMGNDPCTARYGPKAKECIGKDLAARTGPMDSMMPRSEDQLAQHYGAFMQKCPLRTGCAEGEWISTNGTRGVGKAPPGSANDRGVMAGMAGGAGGLGGLNTSVGRLGFNPDHTDPGFGD